MELDNVSSRKVVVLYTQDVPDFQFRLGVMRLF